VRKERILAGERGTFCRGWGRKKRIWIGPDDATRTSSRCMSIYGIVEVIERGADVAVED
jgi:hypothetical protein